MDPVHRRIAAVTVATVLIFVGAGIALVGLLGTAAGDLLGVPPGLPQVGLGAGLFGVGYGLAWAAWRSAPAGDEEEEE